MLRVTAAWAEINGCLPHGTAACLNVLRWLPLLHWKYCPAAFLQFQAPLVLLACFGFCGLFCFTLFSFCDLCCSEVCQEADFALCHVLGMSITNKLTPCGCVQPLGFQLGLIQQPQLIAVLGRSKVQKSLVDNNTDSKSVRALPQQKLHCVLEGYSCEQNISSSEVPAS